MQEEIIKKIIERRKARGLSLRKMGEKTGIYYTHLKKIEHFEISPTLATLEKLLPSLGLELVIREKQ